MCGFSQKVMAPDMKAVPNTGVCPGSLHIVGVQELEWRDPEPRTQHPFLPPAFWENDAFVAIFKLQCMVAVVTSEENGPCA